MPGPVTLLDESSDWCSGDRRFDPRIGDSLPTADSRKAWRKYGHLVLVNRLGSLPRNSVHRLTDQLDMILVVDWVVKPQYKQKLKIWSNWPDADLFPCWAHKLVNRA